MLKFTRVYKLKATGAIKKQRLEVDPYSVESVRASNRLAGQRSTVTLKSGKEFELADVASKVREAVDAAI